VVQVVLVGRPRLTETLSSRSLRGLATRIASTITVSRLTTDEAADFIKDRLVEGGVDNPETVFSLDALMVIARQCEGVLARCSTLARESMKRAADCDASVVTPEFVSDAATVFAPSHGDYEKTERLRVRPRPRWMSAPAGLAAGVLGLAVIVAATQVTLMDPWNSDVPDKTPLRAAVGSVPDPRAGGQVSGDIVGTGRLARDRSLREIFLADTPYEVKVKPPKRPAQAEDTATKPGTVHPRPEPAAARGNVSERPEEAVGPSTPKQPAQTATPAAPAAVGHTPAVKTAGLIGLQVAAFRSLASAEELKSRLSKQFADVYVSEVISGGEPLYRVRVGKFKTSQESDALRAKLQAAGYASFRVSD
jgi:cell division septation protein DedD